MQNTDISSHRTLLLSILDFPWPDCAESDLSDELVIAPEDSKRLNQLMSVFGLPYSTDKSSLEELQYAHTVIQVGLGLQVKAMLEPPYDAAGLTQGWPADWVRYLKAVVKGDTGTAKLLARALGVGGRHCEYPAGVDLRELMRMFPN